MSDCSYTAFSAPKPIRGQINWANGHRPTPLSYARFVNGEERKAEYVEIDGVKFMPERTCDVVGTRFEDLLDEYCHSLSCGHDAWNRDSEPPRYCEECGARVKEAN